MGGTREHDPAVTGRPPEWLDMIGWEDARERRLAVSHGAGDAQTKRRVANERQEPRAEGRATRVAQRSGGPNGFPHWDHVTGATGVLCSTTRQCDTL